MHEELSGWSLARLLEPTDLGQTDLTWRVPAAGIGHSRFAANMFVHRWSIKAFSHDDVPTRYNEEVWPVFHTGSGSRADGTYKKVCFFVSWRSLVAKTANRQRGIKGETASRRAEETSL